MPDKLANRIVKKEKRVKTVLTQKVYQKGTTLKKNFQSVFSSNNF
jgi:hypothetical protein